MIKLIKNTENKIGLFSVGIEIEDINSTLKELKSKGAKITRYPTAITNWNPNFLRRS